MMHLVAIAAIVVATVVGLKVAGRNRDHLDGE